MPDPADRVVKPSALTRSAEAAPAASIRAGNARNSIAAALINREAAAQEKVEKSARGMPSPKIKDVQVIAVQPGNVRLIVVKILTDHPDILDSKKLGPDADPLIIALALEIGGVVVTGDGSTGRSGKTQIKDVCSAYGVRCIDVDEFLTENGWT